MDNTIPTGSTTDSTSSPQFDPTINMDYHEDYNNQQTLAKLLVGGTVASAADFAGSIWNSLPFTPEVSTEDILRKVSNSALEVYQQHPDAIQAASFLGGSLIPAGLAMKGMAAARAGVKGVNWFSKAGRVEDLAKIDTLFQEGADSTALYRRARTEFFVKGVANQVIDAAAMEAAVVGTMNAHPFLEDYLADPVKNFAISVAEGGVLGGTLGHIIDRFEVGKLIGAAETKSISTVLDEFKVAREANYNATQLQIHEATSQGLTKIIEGDYNDLTKQMASKFKLSVQGSQEETFQKMLTPELAALPDEAKTMLKAQFSSDPAMQGVEKIGLLTQSSETEVNALKDVGGAFRNEANFTLHETKDEAGNVLSKSLSEVGYYPEFGRFASPDDAKNYARARDLGKDIGQLDKELGPNFGVKPNISIGEELLSASSAVVDAKYLASLNRVDSMGEQELARLAIANDDLPTISAVLSRINKEPDLFGDLKIRVTDSLPTYGKLSTDSPSVNYFSKEDLSSYFVDKKDALVRSMLDQAIPMEAIAIRTNTPLDTVMKFAGSPKGTSLIELGPISEYRDVAAMDNYLDPAKRALKLSSNIDKMSHGELKAGLDIKTAADMDHEIKSTFFAQSDSKIVNLLGSRLFGEYAPQLDILRAQLGNFVNTKAGARFINSFDFFARNMEEAGTTASFIGKNIQHTANEAENMILKPIRERMATVVTNDVALTEMNTARELNASLKGYRIYAERQFWQKEVSLDALGKEVETMVPARFQGNEFKIANDDVDALLSEMNKQGRELYSMNETKRQVLGQKPMSDIGFWIPTINPTGKHISYVWDIDGTTKMLWGNTEEELKAAEGAFRATLTPEQLKNTKIVVKGDQKVYNMLQGRNDAINMEIANIGMNKTGSTASAIVKANTDILSELVGGYQHNINSNIRQMADIAMADITDGLNRMSEINQQYFKDQPLSKVGKLLQSPKDTASVVRNTLLGNSNLADYTNWAEANKVFEVGLSLGVNTVSKLWKNMTDPLRKGFLGGTKDLTAEMMQKADYETFAKKLEDAGVYNPWKAFDNELEKNAAGIYALAKNPDTKDASARIVNTSNAFAATLALKMGDLAQGLVNMMSLPILTSLAAATKQPETFMGIQKGTAKIRDSQIMYEGMRAAHDPAFAHLGKMWEDLGYFKPMISEANDTLALSRNFDKGAMATVQKALDSQLISIMSKPADWSETMVRRQAMYTGAVLAKRLYPTLDDLGATIFARDFMDRSVGNFHASQRPVFFQGTLGVALGLFQTYMLTMAQNVYRAVETRNFKAIGKAALLQQGIFGAQSMPGFNQVSEAIGDHYSQNHYDLTTGTYRATGDKMADFLMYGLPSNLGPALYTRGDTNPRFPNLLTNGVKDIVGVNFAMQATDSISHLIDAVKSQRPDIAQAFGEALSMQSMSRPVARLSELATGYSITQKGNTIQTPAEVWTATGIMSRILAVRPLEEAKLRQADHLNTFYGAQDRDNRNKLMMSIKTALRNGTLDDALVSKVSEEYLRKGGSPTGWRSAYNTAVYQTNVGGKATLMDKLDPDSAVNYMVNSLD